MPDTTTSVTPTGSFACRRCAARWSASQLRQLPLFTSVVWACADPQCGGEVEPLPAAMAAPAPPRFTFRMLQRGPSVWSRRPLSDP
ncbi:MAG: hypothetical protein M3R24_13960 [Chloroflexota bacterium]|nr:hypothetical protein [Chloroflexota bacterium]